MPEYYVLNLTTRQPYKPNFTDGSESELITFPNGEAAAEFARELTETTGIKHQPRIFKPDADWKDREQIRLLNGTYKPLPWDYFSRHHIAVHTSTAVRTACMFSRAFDAGNQNHDAIMRCEWFYSRRKADCADHFAHISNKPGNVSFTENESKGARDIQTSIRVGRYLERFYDLSAGDIKILSDTFNLHHGINRLCFATTAKDIETIYKRGPSSCMSHSNDHFYNSIHPTIVYGNSDLQLAYIGAFDDKDRLIAVRARCLIYPDKKRYGTMYGNGEFQDMLQNMLRKEGYKGGNFIGARITKIKHPDTESNKHYWVMPYLDDIQSCIDDGDMWKIVSYDDPHDIIASNTNGTIRLATCDHCQGAAGSAYGVYADNEQETWCRTCYEQDAFSCQACGDYHQNTNMVLTANNEKYCRWCKDRVLKVCAATGELWHYTRTLTMDNGDRWSRRYYATHGFRCGTCRRYLPKKTICTAVNCGRPVLTMTDDEGNTINLA
jgi:hypothetical protein